MWIFLSQKSWHRFSIILPTLAWKCLIFSFQKHAETIEVIRIIVNESLSFLPENVFDRRLNENFEKIKVVLVFEDETNEHVGILSRLPVRANLQSFSEMTTFPGCFQEFEDYAVKQTLQFRI